MSIRTTKPYLEEHAELRDQVERFLVIAHELPRLEIDERIDVIESVVAFLAEILLPHAAAEQRILYPQASYLLGEEDESDACALDLALVRERLAELATADADDYGHLQEILYGVYAVMSAHFWREEGIYLKLLAAQSGERVGALLAEVSERATAATGGRFARRLTPAQLA